MSDTALIQGILFAGRAELFEALINAVIPHPSLRFLAFSTHQLPTFAPFVKLIATNRTLRTISAWMTPTPEQQLAVIDALLGNFVLTSLGNFTSHYFPPSVPPSDPSRRIRALLDRNESVEWRKVHAVLLDAYIALSALQLPPYVMLWIVDWLPHYEHVSRIKKVALLESLYKSMAIKKRRWEYV